jgi:hypothetical protein
MSRSLGARWTVAAGLALAAGCTSVRPITGSSIAGRDIQVEFARPRDVEVLARGGGVVLLDDVRAVRGRAVDVRGDTLVLEVSSWRGSGIWQPRSPAVVAALLFLDPELLFGEHRLSTKRTLLAAVGVPAVVLALLYWLAITVGRIGGNS